MHEFAPKETFPRAAGISLSPRRLSAGTLGAAAGEFVDFLCHAGVSYWHVLDIGPRDPGGLPLSVFAKDPGLVDLDLLARAGLGERAAGADEHLAGVRAAAAHLVSQKDAHALFAGFAQFREGRVWLDDWALFAALQEREGPVSGWPEALRHRSASALAQARAQLADEMLIHQAVQFFADLQWNVLKVQGYDTGVRFLMDLRARLSPEGCDVWTTPGQFVVEDEGARSKFARMSDDGFRFWRTAFAEALDTAQLVRLLPVATLAEGAVSLVDAFRNIRRNMPLIPDDADPFSEGQRAFRTTVRLPDVVELTAAFGHGAEHRHLPHHHGVNTVVLTRRPEHTVPVDEGAATTHLAAYMPHHPPKKARVRLGLMSAAHTALIDARDLFADEHDRFDVAQFDPGLADRLGEEIALFDRDELKRMREQSMRQSGKKPR